MTTYRVNKGGTCPYCLNPTELVVVEKVHPSFTAMQCVTCNNFSVRHENGYQYPIEDRQDHTSAPAVEVHYME